MDREELLQQLSEMLLRQNKVLVTAESCTGGGVASACTDLPGSSQWFSHGLVTYSNESKQCFLNVPPDVLEQFGAVSEETVLAMVAGAVSEGQVALSISGVAGPDGGTAEKPVGTVWFAWGDVDQQMAHHHLFFGSRTDVREQAIDYALEGMIGWLERK